MDIQVINIYDELNKPFEESYKDLRENLRFCDNNKDIRTITITSCKPKEGKTTVAINSAISFARAGYNVLLMDADLRKPKSKKYFAKDKDNGIADYMNNYVNCIEDIVCETSIENLNYVPAGNNFNNPSEIIASLKFKELLSKFREKYDYVIIDTPPIGSVIDGSVVASITDGTVLVVEVGEIDREVAYRTKAQLSNANANILGVVLNRINKRDYKKYYRYYNYCFNDKSSVSSKIKKEYQNKKILEDNAT